MLPPYRMQATRCRSFANPSTTCLPCVFNSTDSAHFQNCFI
uniref:Uncharacterized protein n=1 Tax=Globisporangium ultimum (strain ATCC 200006 / CBS 805.95 / DAOM BR144) TaxID=431595 RepID=K3XB88_GLOUD